MAQPWRIVLTFLSACICFTNHVNAEIWKVATASEFQAALRGVAPGDVVQLAPVEFYGFFAAEIDGTPQDKITIQGNKLAPVGCTNFSYFLPRRFQRLLHYFQLEHRLQFRSKFLRTRRLHGCKLRQRDHGHRWEWKPAPKSNNTRH